MPVIAFAVDIPLVLSLTWSRSASGKVRLDLSFISEGVSNRRPSRELTLGDAGLSRRERVQRSEHRIDLGSSSPSCDGLGLHALETQRSEFVNVQKHLDIQERYCRREVTMGANASHHSPTALSKFSKPLPSLI